MVIRPSRAPVRPRVLRSEGDSGGPQLLEDCVARWLEREVTGTLWILGGVGSGRTTALAHIAAAFEDEPRFTANDNGVCVLRASASDRGPDTNDAGALARSLLERLQLAPWGEDDCIEYLLHRHAEQCASVMARLQATDDLRVLGGNPELIVAVLDAMARDAAISGAKEALQRCAAAVIGALEHPDAHVRSCVDLCLAAHADDAQWPPSWNLRAPLLRHEEIFARVAAPELVRRLVADSIAPDGLRHLRAAARRSMAPLLRAAPEACERLHHRLDETSASEGGVIATLLHEADGVAFAAWLRESASRRAQPLQLVRAKLTRAPWSEVELGAVKLHDTNLANATLIGADLEGAEARYCSLTGADLGGARLNRATFIGAALERTQFQRVSAQGLHVQMSHLPQADFEGARLDGARFLQSVLDRARFRGASLVEAQFESVTLEDVDFRDADLSGAVLSRLDLRTCTFGGARLERAALVGAHLDEANFEQVDLNSADLSEAVLHGANLRGAQLDSAKLIGAKLAQVDAEGADFRNVDFTGATFHLGTTRSGLVFNAPPMEGSKTGFYSDDFFASPYRRPEDVRSANLRGARLIGAVVETADFYLVDLRDALFDSRQLEHFRRCGAILRDRR